ncbi:MAG: endonuclease [Candidatus Eremiobacteraeota bacterium]|nr:endonuclease [Candidatus Eremiobacteraeota bacterium]
MSLTISRESYFTPSRIPVQIAAFDDVTAGPQDLFKTADHHDEVHLMPPPARARNMIQTANGARPYYDAKADAQAQAAYYQDFTLNTDDGKEAFELLSALVKETHTTLLEYHPEKYVYPWVDRRPDGQVQSIYSPESLTEISPARQRALDKAMAQMVSFAPFAPETVAAHVSLTQSAGSLNCEHVVPQSWYCAKEPMRGDLHHLFACDSRCNSYRGNRRYVESSGLSNEKVAKCGIRTDSDKGFQPMAGHGAVARATLYFMLRYPKKAAAYSADDLALLLKWHKQEPPSLYEKHRNQAIEEMQGNRNPLIDHPEWAEKIDFTQGVLKNPRL